MLWIPFTEPGLAQKPFGICVIGPNGVERGPTVFAEGHDRHWPFFLRGLPIPGIEPRVLIQQAAPGQLGHGPSARPAIIAEQLPDGLFVFS